MPQEDTREAARLLHDARATKYPHLYDAKRAEAAMALVKSVLDVARRAGFTVTRDADDVADVIVPNANVEGTIWLSADQAGVHVGYSQVGLSERLADADLEFDAADGRWVGRGRDTFLTPVPGEPVARRSGSAAVVDRLLEALAKVH
jgi:hypothetical protein